MAFNEIVQRVAAGSQLDGTVGKGRFESVGQSGMLVQRVSLSMGNEPKAWEIAVVEKGSNRIAALLDNQVGLTTEQVDLLGPIAVSGQEYLRITTSGATAEMFAKIVTQEVKG